MRRPGAVGGGRAAVPRAAAGQHPLTRGDENARLFDYEQRVKSSFDAIVPVLKVVHDSFGIESGHVESCHSYTNDQNLIDNFHKKSRRGREGLAA